MLVAGAAAGVAAIFKAPATGAVFALEVPYQDEFARHMLIPSLVGAATGYLTFAAFHGTEPLFAVAAAPPFRYIDLIAALALGVAAGLGARRVRPEPALGQGPGHPHGGVEARAGRPVP